MATVCTSCCHSLQELGKPILLGPHFDWLLAVCTNVTAAAVLQCLAPMHQIPKACLAGFCCLKPAMPAVHGVPAQAAMRLKRLLRMLCVLSLPPQVRMWEMITYAMASLGAAAQAGGSGHRCPGCAGSCQTLAKG